MPYIKPSWRQWPQMKWLSELLCKIWIHHWIRSVTLKKNIACVICGHRSKFYNEYAARTKGQVGSETGHPKK